MALAGCGATAGYIYSPQGATTWTDGYPATTVAVPPEAPQGSVTVTSFGMVQITPDGSNPIDVLQVRMTVSNDGDDTPWTVSTSDQLVEIVGEGRSGPIYVNTDAPSAPAIPIARRERRVFDLYYPLPANFGTEALPAFDFLWQVNTAARPYASRTRFERIETQPPTYGDVVLYSGWGPYWWYDPFYPRRVFVHHHPIIVHGGHHVTVTRPPFRQRARVRDHR
ncbi:MAG TPA: hypothetical protein VHE35_20090 [Kofleriaceae bacterium]|nr:hypothetical protein [Kofleriaceae bacterium]